MKNLNELNQKELRELCKKYGVKGYWLMKKADIIAEIERKMALEEVKEEVKEEVEEVKEEVEEVKEEVVEATEEVVEEVVEATEEEEANEEEANEEESEEESEEEESEEELSEEEAKKAKRRAYRAARRAAKKEGTWEPRKVATYEFNGKVQTLTEWAEELGIARKTLNRRIKKMGWTIEKAFSTPATERKAMGRKFMVEFEFYEEMAMQIKVFNTRDEAEWFVKNHTEDGVVYEYKLVR